MVSDPDDEGRAEQRKARRRARREKDDRKTTIGALMDHPAGRDFLWWLLTIGKVGVQPFSNNALISAFNCGELNVGNQVLAEIMEAAPAGYVRMLQERSDGRPSDPDDSDDDGDSDYPNG